MTIEHTLKCCLTYSDSEHMAIARSYERVRQFHISQQIQTQHYFHCNQMQGQILASF